MAQLADKLGDSCTVARPQYNCGQTERAAGGGVMAQSARFNQIVRAAPCPG